MRLTFRVSLAMTIGFGLIAFVGAKTEVSTATVVQKQLLWESDSLLSAIRLLRSTPLDVAHTSLLKRRFLSVRLSYKRLEWAAEYFAPLTTRFLNGPPVSEAEPDGTILQPEGLQVLEALLFPDLQIKESRQIRSLSKRLTLNVTALKDIFLRSDPQDWQILDAAKLEVFRIEALGLTDFDDPVIKNCRKESAAALQGLAEVIHRYDPAINFDAAIRSLNEPTKIDQFNRATFIIHCCDPLTRALSGLKSKLDHPGVKYNRLLRQEALTLFDKNAFNRNAFIDAPGDSATNEKIALGKRLFFDPILSGSSSRTCASCHQPDKAFSDGLEKNFDLSGKKTIARNTPTLINAALQPAQFYDLRSSSLEDQANDVIRNKAEMHGDMKIATSRLWSSADYRLLFEQAYPKKGRTAIDTFEVMNALASYVRSLTALNSRFDDYMRGERTAISSTALKGFNLFMGKAKCATCHFMPLFNGALPPRYMRMEVEVIGVPVKRKSRVVDPDPGRYGIQPIAFNQHAFKSATIRNAARTAPYMHNGAFKTLEEVIDFYDSGGGIGNGVRQNNQTLDPKPLHLTKSEKKELVAFIKSLNSH